MINKHSALLIIDMQKESFTPLATRYDATDVISRINLLAQKFRGQELPVFYIQHDGAGSGICDKGTTEWELLDELDYLPSDVYIDKYANDCFYKSQLEQKLKKLGVSNLYITGCATDFCVESTIQSALTKDFHVYVISDAHTTADRPHLSAEQIIIHHNWVWNNMIPTDGSIQVLKTEEIIYTEEIIENL